MANTLAGIEEGMKLHAIYAADGEYYPAIVKAVSSSKRRAKAPVKVQHVGYDEETWVSVDALKSKKIGLKAPEAPAPKAKAKAKAKVKAKAKAKAEPPIDWDTLSFAMTPTDVMYIAECKEGQEWAPGKTRPYGNISMSPAAGVLNYGQGVFEGMKAQRTESGEIVLFRPDANADRMRQGAIRLGMPAVPEKIFLDAVEAVVAANTRWVPPHGKGALYVRPCLWGSGPVLALKPPPLFTFCIYASPVGPYFKGGLKCISLLVSKEFHRASRGGQGGIKAVGNYAAGMMPAGAAKEKGFDELLYLDAQSQRYIEEAGAANFFCVKDGVVHTPELTGSILPGVTRMSIIQIAKDLGHEVREGRLEVDFITSADEAFCTGTAAVITPIGVIEHEGGRKEYCGGNVGEVTRKLYDALLGIQQCKHDDKHGWVRKVVVQN